MAPRCSTLWRVRSSDPAGSQLSHHPAALLLVVGCPIVLRPCAFGMVAVNLARLIILHGSALVALVIYLIYLNVPSFCLLGMVGSLQIKFVTLMLCMVGWLVHVQETLWFLVHPWLVLVCIMVLVTFRFIGLAPLWVWLGLFGSLPPWFPFCGVGWFFAGLFAPLVWSGRLGLPPWSRLFPLRPSAEVCSATRP